MLNEKKLTRAAQKALRPKQILDAAFEEFVAHGFTATRVEDIADRIGVTKGTIYVYFPTKEDLFSAMMRIFSVPLEELLRNMETLKGGMPSVCDIFCFSPMIASLRTPGAGIAPLRDFRRRAVSAGHRHAPRRADRPSHRMHAKTLEEGIAAGEFRDCEGANAEIIVAPIVALMMDHLIFDGRRSVDIAAYVRSHLDLVFNGLSPRGA